MSYDLEIATRERPSLEQIEAWAAGRRLKAASQGGGQVVVSKPSWLRGERYLFSLEQPESAEPEDFHPLLTEVYTELRWTTAVNVPYSVPRRAVDLVLALAEHLAELGAGAVFDPQLNEVCGPTWPPARCRRPGRRGR